MSDEVLHPAIAAIAHAALGSEAAAGPVRPGEHVDPVERATQAETLALLMATQGPDGLLAAGRHLDAVVTEPLVIALLNTDSPALLLEKVAQLNRFLHSHHRHRVLHLDARGVELEHCSTTGASPAAIESLFVCGLYLELLGRIGCRGVTCAFPDAVSGARDVYCDGSPWGVPGEATQRWRIGWAAFEPTRPLPGLDEILLRDRPTDLSDRTAGAKVEAILRTDLSRGWRVDAVASRLAVSGRTLQRQLRQEGRPFTEIVRSTRIAAAEDLLRDPTRSITDVGYVTGFADTAHFTRTFKQATGSTPSSWRAQHARSSGDHPLAARSEGFEPPTF